MLLNSLVDKTDSMLPQLQLAVVVLFNSRLTVLFNEVTSRDPSSAVEYKTLWPTNDANDGNKATLIISYPN